MKPIEKVSNDLFQLLRSRFRPVKLGTDDATTTNDPSEAVLFSFTYKENNKSIGVISINISNRRSLKIYYTNEMVTNIKNTTAWYEFLKSLRFFARSNLMGFDARDISKSELDPRDFEFISVMDTPYEKKDIEINESVLSGTLKKSYQQIGENVKLLINHTQQIDPNIPGARSRRIDSMFIERNDGERYRVPFRHLNGARSLACHVSAGGNPYDSIGCHIVETVQSMMDLSKFARLTRKVANESNDANSLREQVIKHYVETRKHLMKLQKESYYQTFKENFDPTETNDVEPVDGLREKFTRKVWNEEIERLLPVVSKIIGKQFNSGDNNMNMQDITESRGNVEKTINNPNFHLVLRKDVNLDSAITTMKFNSNDSLMVYILGDIAARAIGDDMDSVANFAAEMSDRVGSEGAAFSNLGQGYAKNKAIAMLLAKTYIQDLKKIKADPDYVDVVRKDPTEIYGNKKKRDGSDHTDEEMIESKKFDKWAWATTNDDFDEPVDHPVFQAIKRRIDMRYPEVYEKHGVKAVEDAIMDQADFVGDDVEEIGSSDVSIWTKYVLQSIGHVTEATTQGTTGTVGTSSALPKKTDQEKVNQFGGGDPAKTRMIKTVSDKLVRGARLTPQEQEIADELAATTITKESTVSEKELNITDDNDSIEDGVEDDIEDEVLESTMTDLRRLAGLL